MRALLSLVIAVILVGAAAAAAGADLGVVVLHGKLGSPAGPVARLVTALEAKGYLVAAPATSWSRNRMYDATFDESMRELDREIEGLRKRGARSVVIIGHSMGGNAALGYVASREGVSGVAVLGPGHTPESPLWVKTLGADLQRARDLIAAGKGTEKQRFMDINQGDRYQVTTTPDIYVSWFDPQGAAVLPKSAAAIRTALPLLLVVGNRESVAWDKYLFEKAPPHPKSKFLTVAASHFDVPTAALDDILSWVASLQ